ncbi:hypothetical protein C5S32_12310 [ANME-1 cluster archaeon GoMg1]|nr:hypothetical protein [ANME-1 cluster archaeon GoMg1]
MKNRKTFVHDSAVAIAPLPFGSANRVYQVRATPSPKILASLGTLDILKML